MQIALIPPVPDLERFAVGGSHLLLSHLVKKFPEYEKHYQARREEGDYLILDNSAHEHGKGNEMQALLRQVKRLNAQEVVVPDVLFDARATVESARQSIRWLCSQQGERAFARAGRPRLMYVPQGDTRPEWAWCLRELMTAHANLETEPPVIGVSKDYYYWTRGLTALIQDYIVDLRVQEGIDLHCLGWPTDLWTLALVTRDHPWVRSTDSAKPFVYAKHKILLEPGGQIPDYPRRDKRYFQDGLDEKVMDIAERNIEVFRAAAEDKLILPREKARV